jgi:SLOG cluster4 family
VAPGAHYIAVAGAGACEPEVARVAEEVGWLLAHAGATLVCGGLGGVMDTWELSKQGRPADAIVRAVGPEEALALALRLAVRPGA